MFVDLLCLLNQEGIFYTGHKFIIKPTTTAPTSYSEAIPLAKGALWFAMTV